MGQSIFQTIMPPIQQIEQAPQTPVQQPMSGAAQFANPVQKMQYVMQAMTNPAQFMKEKFPDIPENIMYDPNKVMSYLQQTRGISNEQVNQVVQQMPKI